MSRAVAVKFCNVTLEVCVLWVLLDSREECFFLLTCTVSVDYDSSGVYF